MIKIDYSWQKYEIEKSIFQVAANILAQNEKIKEGTIDLRITENKEIKELNKKYRSIDKSTDVLAFREDEVQENYDGWPVIENDEQFFGEIIISVEKAIEQSSENSKTEIEELIYLFIHGFLHLLGYDHLHEEEKKIMFEKNDTIFQQWQKEIEKTNKKYEITKT